MHLRLSSAEFYRLTPRQYRLLMDRHQERAEHDELMFGILTSTIVNFKGKMLRNGSEVKPSDYMPILQAKERKRKHDPVASANMISNFLWAQVKAQGQTEAPPQ